jgi:hypothetical protein
MDGKARHLPSYPFLCMKWSTIFKIVGQLKFACPEEREELAYKAQESWLHLFGHDLEHDFQMDPFTILVKSKCF